MVLLLLLLFVCFGDCNVKGDYQTSKYTKDFCKAGVGEWWLSDWKHGMFLHEKLGKHEKLILGERFGLVHFIFHDMVWWAWRNASFTQQEAWHTKYLLPHCADRKTSLESTSSQTRVCCQVWSHCQWPPPLSIKGVLILWLCPTFILLSRVYHRAEVMSCLLYLLSEERTEKERDSGNSILAHQPPGLSLTVNTEFVMSAQVFPFTVGLHPACINCHGFSRLL